MGSTRATLSTGSTPLAAQHRSEADELDAEADEPSSYDDDGGADDLDEERRARPQTAALGRRHPWRDRSSDLRVASAGGASRRPLRIRAHAGQRRTSREPIAFVVETSLARSARGRPQEERSARQRPHAGQGPQLERQASRRSRGSARMRRGSAAARPDRRGPSDASARADAARRGRVECPGAACSPLTCVSAAVRDTGGGRKGNEAGNVRKVIVLFIVFVYGAFAQLETGGRRGRTLVRVVRLRVPLSERKYDECGRVWAGRVRRAAMISVDQAIRVHSTHLTSQRRHPAPPRRAGLPPAR